MTPRRVMLPIAIAVWSACALTIAGARATPPAFPGAEGAGATATGGRGGTVYHVTNLNAQGPGSLADAVSQPNRIVVFDVSGTIDLLQEKPAAPAAKIEALDDAGGAAARSQALEKARQGVLETAAREQRDQAWIDKKLERAQLKFERQEEESDLPAPALRGGRISVAQPNITIAGQTAPGEGVCIIHGSLSIDASNVIVRHLRVRRGHIADGEMGDAITVKGEDRRLENIMLDHLSASWAADENLTMTNNVTSGTAQYCIAAEGLDYFNRNQTPPRHSEGSLFGSIVPDGCLTFHHIVYANNRLRNPRITGGIGDRPAVHDLRNCVVFNWIELPTHTGSGGAKANLIGNYYKPGVDTWDAMRSVIFEFNNKRAPFQLFASGNYLEGNPACAADNWSAICFGKDGGRIPPADGAADKAGPAIRADKPFAAPFVTTQDARDAYEACLADAGATLPGRDPVDLRILQGVRHGAGRVIDRETDLPERRRWPTYWSLSAPADTDRDGMPDDWEAQYGFDAKRDDGMADADGDGYANVEEYLNNTDPTGGATPIVWISAPVSRANKYEGFAGQLQVTRAGGAMVKDGRGGMARPLTVRYSVSGTALSGADYDPLPGKVTIPTGQSSAIVHIAPRLEDRNNMGQLPRQEDVSVVLTLERSGEYNVGCPRSAMVVIQEH